MLTSAVPTLLSIRDRMRRTLHGICIAVSVASIVALVAAWSRLPIAGVADLTHVSEWLARYRHAWYGLPLVVATFTVLGLALVPVLLLVAATGIAFGPWLGPLYAMAGCLASGSTGFALGRLVGRDRVARLGGTRLVRISHALERNGTLAIFLLRKIPAPFLLSNIVAGASHVRYRDFVLGTLLGMGAFVLALAGFGSRLTDAIAHPTPASLLSLAALLAFPFGIAWITNHALKRRHHHVPHHS
jgi:phospholipase D1/2